MRGVVLLIDRVANHLTLWYTIQQCEAVLAQILGVAPTATQEQIRSVKFSVSKAFHPDKFARSSLEQQRTAHERTRAINEAYQVLSDPIARANYDREHARPTETGSAQASTPPPPPPQKPPESPPPPDPTAIRSPELRHFWAKFFSDYLFLHGRIGRATFIARTSAILGLSVVISALAAATKVEAITVVAGVVILIFFLSFVIQVGKRLHDINASAAWVLAGVTGLGLLVLILILPFAPGTNGLNRFGSQSLASRRMKITAVTICVLGLLSVIASIIISENNKPQGVSSTAVSAPLNSSSKIAPMEFGLSPTPSTLTQYSGLKLNTNKLDLAQPTPGQARIVEGTSLHYSLALPADWTVKRKHELSKEEADFDLVASHKAVYIGVIAEEANLGDVDTVVSFSRRLLTERNTDARFSNVETVSIDGRKWRTFNAHVAVEKIPFAYQFYVSARTGRNLSITGMDV